MRSLNFCVNTYFYALVWRPSRIPAQTLGNKKQKPDFYGRIALELVISLWVDFPCVVFPTQPDCEHPLGGKQIHR